MLGLVDGNNFYASCERVFNPSLHGRPVVVLSNNDACAIARSQEAKDLGVGMGQPIHEVPDQVRRQLKVLSANFGLYGDLSGRVVSILRDLFPQVEVYSIDESFVSFDGIRKADHERVATEARARILKWTGIPCCVGIGPTKTLAKLGNKAGKKTPHGVMTAVPGSRLLERFDVEDVWGVGHRTRAKLDAEGILTAADLARADPETVRARYGVTLARTQRELQGIACSELEEVEPERQQIVVSRSFGKEVVAMEDLQQAVATFAQRACEKLRGRSLQAGGVWVFFHTNPFKPGTPQYHPSKAFNFVAPTVDTREVLMVAQGLTKAMWRQGYRYKKAGIGLLDLTAGDVHQGDLFAQVDPRSKALMEVMDKANAKFGRGSMAFASSAKRVRGGAQRRQLWAMNQAALSPAYTTRWDQLIRVR
ncbi:Y-family DNA polymerase (plasmid) [Xanthomonas citri pv. citri]|uniref:Y-family DNA polymerase n=1 Tax=Xanthomonas citri TaxID=346 RepID=UPI00193251B4|nr:Y-family DNA polymerase [Xanthomonas citri]QRD62778.1 Y-family DNA polymerase [Xanthomonas citri pv. citri]QRD67105.1 Y-family DNA polymerase [Xanthomonas citri pv. citri]QRD71832.1 Y-family DNA polymerase [Xanthomonas citri pv. citri]